MTAGPSVAAGKNVLWNGAFDGESPRPWSVGFDSPPQDGLPSRTTSSACRSPSPGPSAGAWSSGSGRWRSRAGITISCGCGRTRRRRRGCGRGSARSARPTRSCGRRRPTWRRPQRAPSPSPSTGRPTRTTSSWPSSSAGRWPGATPLTVCLDDVELNDPEAEIPIEKLHPRTIPKVRVNQVGLSAGRCPRSRPIATAGDAPLDWQLVDAAGKVRASGQTRPFGDDRSSGERVQQIDFSSVKTPGRGVQAARRRRRERPLRDPARHLPAAQVRRARLLLPAAQRRPDQDALRRDARLRAPGRAPRRQEASAARPTRPAATRLDASGGWYDAGDHGKYVVNGGFTVWMLQNEYETLSRFGTSAAAFGDGKMKIPESKNGRPDLLDEARFGLDLVPAACRFPRGSRWPGWSTTRCTARSGRPSRPRPRPTTSSATCARRPPPRRLNLAAMAAQAARLWRTLDPAFSARCLTAAETAYAAAKKNPAVHAERDTPGRRRLRRRRPRR